MGIIALDKINNLYWLGRYSERVYTTIKEFFEGYDKMIDDDYFYIEYCNQLQIPNIYTDQRNFIERYLTDSTDENSIVSNLVRAYDNCIVLRNEISTETVTYMDGALAALEAISDIDSFIIELQDVIDKLLAFFACMEDSVEDADVKNIVNLGKRVERLDLYLRLNKDRHDVLRAFHFLEYTINKNILPYNKEQFMFLKEIVESDDIPYFVAVETVESLLD